MELTEEARRAIVESGPVYLKNGLRATMGGWKNPDYCTITSAEPGFWGIAWERIADVVQRPDRRMDWLDGMFSTSRGWLGCLPALRSDWQTEEDYESAQLREYARALGVE